MDSKRSSGEDTRQLVVGLVATLLGAAIVAVLGVLFDALSKPLTLPVWGYLSILTLVLVIAWGVVFIAKQQQRMRLENYEKHLVDAADEKCELQERIAELENGIRLRDEMKMARGLYYRTSDSGLEQPFCRVCWEGDEPKARTVMCIYQNHEGYWQYYCDWCQQSYSLPDSFRQGESPGDDEEIPF